MTFEITGKLYEIFDEQQVSATFRKREFVLEIQDGNYPQYPKFQLTQDKCNLLDNFQTGQEVKVSFNLSGRGYNKNGVTTYFTNLSAWRLEPASGAAAAAPAQQNRNQAPAYSQAPAAAPAAPVSSGLEGDDELPF